MAIDFFQEGPLQYINSCFFLCLNKQYDWLDIDVSDDVSGYGQSELKTTYLNSPNIANLIAGTQLNGTFRHQFLTSSVGAPPIVFLQSISIIDNAGNAQTYLIKDFVFNYGKSMK